MADSPILLLVDLQHGLIEGPSEWGPRSTPDLVSNVTALLSHWRSHGWPVLHMQHDDDADLTNPIGATHSDTYRLHASAQPHGEEPVFVKHTGSAFIGTPLTATLQQLGAGKVSGTNNGPPQRRVVIAGMDGAMCVNSTTRSAVDLGHKVIVVADASASYAPDQRWNDTHKGYDVDAWHDMAMTMLTDGATVISTKELFNLLMQS